MIYFKNNCKNFLVATGKVYKQTHHDVESHRFLRNYLSHTKIKSFHLSFIFSIDHGCTNKTTTFQIKVIQFRKFIYKLINTFPNNKHVRLGGMQLVGVNKSENTGITSVDRSTKATLSTYNPWIQVSRLQKIYHFQHEKLRCTIHTLPISLLHTQEGRDLMLVL